MRRIFLIALFAVFATVLLGCGEQVVQETSGTPSGTQTEVPEGTKPGRMMPKVD
jgi:hypothetical protein